MGWGGQGLGDLKVHKSKLQKDKDAWAKAVSLTVQRRPAQHPNTMIAHDATLQATDLHFLEAGTSLAISCLTTMAHAFLIYSHSDMSQTDVYWKWCLQAAAEADAGTAGTTASRKPLLKESNTTSQKPNVSEIKRVPSYMKSTHTSSTRSSLGSTPETDARFAF